MSRSLLGGREHQITHANVDIELNGDTLDLEIFVICWIGSVDPVDDLCLTNQIYSALLNAFEFKEITEMPTFKCF